MCVVERGGYIPHHPAYSSLVLHHIVLRLFQFLRVARPRVSLQPAATKSAERVRETVGARRGRSGWTWACEILVRHGRWRWRWGGQRKDGDTDADADAAQTPRYAHPGMEEVRGSRGVPARRAMYPKTKSVTATHCCCLFFLRTRRTGAKIKGGVFAPCNVVCLLCGRHRIYRYFMSMHLGRKNT